MLLRNALAVVLAGVCLQGCGSAASSAAPTGAPSGIAVESATAAATQTATASPIPEAIPTSTRKPAPTGTTGCNIPPGWWESRETTYMAWMTTPWPLIAFRVADCEVREFQIEVYPAYGKGFGGNFEISRGEIRDRSFSVTLENPDGPGSFTVYGKFESNGLCRGFIMFSKGFQVGNYILSDAVTVSWNAEPGV